MRTIYRAHEGNSILQCYNNNIDYYTLNNSNPAIRFFASVPLRVRSVNPTQYRIEGD
jgi:hypothetical protein